VLIEEGMKDAIDKVINRITAYWKTDLAQGTPFKLVVTVSNSFDKNEAEDILFAISDLAKKVALNVRENNLSDYTYDALLRCDPARFTSSSDLYRQLRQAYKGRGRVERIALSRKLVLIHITED